MMIATAASNLHIATVSLLAAAGGAERATFAVAAFMVIVGAVGVIASKSPVHSALMLVLTFFGIAVLFLSESANFLAVVQVIVYAGAIVVLFLFVIMFLGVERVDDLDTEPLRSQRPLAVVLMVLSLAGLLLLGIGAKWGLGARSVSGPVLNQKGGDVAALGRAVFTTYLFPFEATAGLLLIAVVGAVVLARRPHSGAAEEEAES